MTTSTTRILLAAVSLALAAALLFQTLGASPAAEWPPPVQEISGEAPALDVDEALETFFLPPGYSLEVVASEPMVQDPIVMDQDADGRLYVVEMPAFALDESMRDSKEPICRVVVLEDEDGDGAMDKRTVFLDGLVLPRAVKVLADGVLVGEPPNLWLAKDTDGDLKADSKTLVRDDFGRADANIEHNANGLYWGMDNTIYTSEHDWNLRWTPDGFVKEESLVRGQWNLSQDDAGRIYRNWNEQPLFADITPVRYFVRNPNVIRTRGLYEELIAREETAIWPVRPTPGLQRAYRKGFLREDGTATTYASSADPFIFRGDRLPEAVQGDAFVADSPTNLVHQLTITDDGTGRLRAKDTYLRGEFLASTDERFRPVNLFSAADGTLYVIDMYRGVVQDIAYQTEYLNTYIREHDLALPVGLGRIYRVVHESMKPGPRPSMSDDSPAELVAHLEHPNGWWRDMAQQLLVQGQARSAAPRLRELAASAPDWRTRLHALWTLDGLGVAETREIEKALGDQSADVRAAAIRIGEKWLRRSGHPLAGKMIAMADDPNWIVRRQLTASLGELPGDARVDPLTKMIERYGDDAITVDAAVSGLNGFELQVLDRLLASDAGAEKTSDAVEMLAGAIARSRDAVRLSRLLDAERTGDGHASAILRGVEQGLAGGGRRGAPPPGPVEMAAAPSALTKLADGQGETSELARSITKNVTWPGKPAPENTGPELTAEQRAHVQEGGKIYANFCAGCHLDSGQGNQGGKTNLVESALVAGNPEAIMRVVLGGKDGETGLMPPLKAALDDDQTAAVISYIRRSWGHEEFVIGGADVEEIRGVTSLRSEPWTDEELEPLINRRYRGAPVFRPSRVTKENSQ